MPQDECRFADQDPATVIRSCRTMRSRTLWSAQLIVSDGPPSPGPPRRTRDFLDCFRDCRENSCLFQDTMEAALRTLGQCAACTGGPHAPRAAGRVRQAGVLPAPPPRGAEPRRRHAERLPACATRRAHLSVALGAAGGPAARTACALRAGHVRQAGVRPVLSQHSTIGDAP